MATVVAMPPATLLTLVARAAETASNSTSTNPSTVTRPPIYRAVGIILAISSGLFIGSSFVIKKTGLLKANAKYNEEAGDGYGYLKNSWWWLGMTIMIVGEICNFVAYAFVDAILVTPMGSLSVVVATVLSAIFLKERLSFVGKVGCFNCIVGSIVIVLNAPQESSVADIQQMQGYVISPGFLSYAGVIIVGCVIIALWAGPRYGKKSMLVYLSICSLIGGLSVVATQGLGAAIVAQAGGEPQFNQWFIYVLLVFVIGTLLTEIIFLNKALNIFNAALVTPTYYVFFTSSTIVSSAILFRGFKGSVTSIITIVMGFFVICSGVILLQLSKSAKNVPDTAVFNGDLDQIRTVAEQEEQETEPKADAIRGTAALIRSISKSRLRKEAEEARRVHEERLEPIGENEQVEWDGLRRRKTSLQPGQLSVRRQKTIHPPLGLTHFPSEMHNDDSDNESHNPEDDHGIFPSFRRHAHTILHRKSHASVSAASDAVSFKSAVEGDGHSVQLSPIRVKAASVSGPLRGDGTADISSQRIQSLDNAPGFGLAALQTQDTEYRSPGVVGSTISWAPSTTFEPTSPRYGMVGPAPPPHGGSTNKRQFSFGHMFTGNRQSAGSRASLGEEQRPGSSASATSFGARVFSGLRKSHVEKTEEERLGLVHGDIGRTREESTAPLQNAQEEAAKGRTRNDKGIEPSDDEEEYDRAGSDESPDAISSEGSGGYARVKRRSRDDDDDDFGFGRGARGAAFV